MASHGGLSEEDFQQYLRECHGLVTGQIGRFVPDDASLRAALYDLVMDYPLRAAKGLRSALCVATCRALGGPLEAVLPSAAVIELYHNAFLVHDDVEDRSEKRRGEATLHRVHGVPVAVNVGDAMLAMALTPLLDNVRVLDLGRALRILQVVARMARETSEGQAIELDWIRRGAWALTDAQYLEMVTKKTARYSFMAPTEIGAIVAGAAPERAAELASFAADVGVAFQIQDDILNLEAEEAAYGKEVGGDLWEGKYTLILIHALRSAPPSVREALPPLLRRQRPDASTADATARVAGTLDALVREGLLGDAARARIADALSDGLGARTEADVALLRRLIDDAGSVAHARQVAQGFARRAEATLGSLTWLGPSVHRDFLEALVAYVVERDR